MRDDTILRAARENLKRSLSKVRVLGAWDNSTVQAQELLDEIEHLIDAKIEKAFVGLNLVKYR